MSDHRHGGQFVYGGAPGSRRTPGPRPPAERAFFRWMMMRRRAREAALGVLFQMDLGKLSLDEALDTVRGPDWPADDWSLVVTLARGTRQNLPQIDALIARVAEHWTVARMATVDRNILRMAIFELMSEATPVGVVINEAVELAKQYSTEESGRFVNGMLGKIVRTGPLPLVHEAADA